MISFRLWHFPYRLSHLAELNFAIECSYRVTTGSTPADFNQRQPVGVSRSTVSCGLIAEAAPVTSSGRCPARWRGLGAGYLNPAAPVERREVSVFTICEPSCGCGKIQNGMGHSCGLHCEKPTVGGNELRPVPISQCNPSCGRCGALFPLRLFAQLESQQSVTANLFITPGCFASAAVLV